ncbi:MAG: GH116 family glycosyl-hydrolase, partial [Bryobacteraceae bacterium]
MSKPTGRRGFLKTVALAAAAPTKPAAAQTPPKTTLTPRPSAPQPVTLPRSSMHYPRVFTGRQLAMLAMPLGGIAAGSISLGGRGQLRDWEIFNRPDKGRSPEYA